MQGRRCLLFCWEGCPEETSYGFVGRPLGCVVQSLDEESHILLLQRYHSCTESLERIYTDSEGVRKREMDAIAGPNEFAEFYARFKILKDAHRRNPDEVTIQSLFGCADIEQL